MSGLIFQPLECNIKASFTCTFKLFLKAHFVCISEYKVTRVFEKLICCFGKNFNICLKMYCRFSYRPLRRERVSSKYSVQKSECFDQL